MKFHSFLGIELPHRVVHLMAAAIIEEEPFDMAWVEPCDRAAAARLGGVLERLPAALRREIALHTFECEEDEA